MSKNTTAAAKVFAKKSELKELFFTTDGQAFYTEGPAKVHQREIGGKADAIEKVENAPASPATTEVATSDKPEVATSDKPEVVVNDEADVEAGEKKK